MDILADLPFQHDDEGRLMPIRTCVVYAWCLMTNHFHLLVMEKDWKIADVIKSLASSYVYYYNKKNERIGHLFQERFKSEPCNDMEYFTTLLRYIHQNPVKAGIVENAADYEWSSWSQDYLREADEGWPISHVKAVLKRIPLEDLTALVNEPCDANCVDVDNSRRLQDSEVRDFIIEQCSAKSVAEFQRLTMEEQTEIVRSAREEGASIRQVMTHTGWSYRRVREAGSESALRVAGYDVRREVEHLWFMVL
jgi:hypothetical protein